MNTVEEEEENFPGRLLHQAALWDNAELLEDLLRGDELSYINSRDSWGRTPLHAASTTENSTCLRVLLQSGADPNIACGQRGESKTPLHICAEYGFTNNVKMLLSYKANLILKDSNGLTAYDIAENGDHSDCAHILKEAADAYEESRLASYSALMDCVLASNVSNLKALLCDISEEDIPFLVNMTPNGSNTLLFIACEVGQKEIVKLLLVHGADGRIHPVTKYSPLYIACFKGWKEVVDILLNAFPHLIQQSTVEKWLPIHAACINGHIAIVDMLLNYPYPAHLNSTYSISQLEYEMAFDVNAKDITGQNLIYMATLLGNSKMVDALLEFKVKESSVKRNKIENNEVEAVVKEEFAVVKRSKISNGIQSIMSKLNLGSAVVSYKNSLKETTTFSPWQLDEFCNNNAESALHAATRSRHVQIVESLLKAGANPNLNCYCVDQSEHPSPEYKTALVVACENRDFSVAESLLKFGARDDDNRALSVAIKNNDDVLMDKLLTIKAYPDPEYKINKKAMNEIIPINLGSLTNFTYSNMFASTPVMINWHNDHRCQMNEIKMQWLVDAALQVNRKLKSNPRSDKIALYAITRLDISNNSLADVPGAIFQLQSLRYLNLAQNKIERLPCRGDLVEESEKVVHTKRRLSKSNFTQERLYSLPCLEELYLQDNRLEEIPEDVLSLPCLVTLDASNNKLQLLPYRMWKAPNLKEFNVAFNLLKDLPAVAGEEDADKSSIPDMSASSLDASNQAGMPFKWKKASLELDHRNGWSESLVVCEQILRVDNEHLDGDCSQITSLNLAHNQFAAIPAVLPCLAVNLTRLNMAYNQLRTMSYITSYPNSLKQVDLSHNKICVWPSLPRLDEEEHTFTACYQQDCPFKGIINSMSGCGSGGGRRQSLRSCVLSSVCPHRRHLRLDNLRTLILADNDLSRIQLTTDDDGGFSMHSSRDDLSEWVVDSTLLKEIFSGRSSGGQTSGNNGISTTSFKSRLMFPNLSMLDMSNNRLKEIPAGIQDLNNLSVLNVAGNADIMELPPQMGLLTRLWNLNTKGCSLQEPLKSMIDSNKYKTMDVIGYLKSILEDARPYARMKLMIVGVQGIGKTSLLDQLRQEGSYKKKSSDWTKRMQGNGKSGSGNGGKSCKCFGNISTVGVDIGDWIYEKKVRGQSSHGPVTFRTWDFGGQREYYATHQYFLSKRSLYVVVWRIPDGQRGIAEILQWLVNIQARAPNSPVLIVGTHYDMMKEHYPETRSEDLQQYIRDKFINVSDAEKCGLPRVLDTIEISCKTRHNVKLLCNLIYDTVFSLRLPGSKELLLEQRVPATYLMLEDVISFIAADRKNGGLDPVLNAQQYKSAVSNEMLARYQKSFRDWGELHQATLFLHDNGVLLHYDDATLRDLYFLDPQWLCDMLAHVVTIREINPFIRYGVMKLDDLKLLFKSSNANVFDVRTYIVNLLNKFEVALTWDTRTLLIPSLMPCEEESATSAYVRIPLKLRGWGLRKKHDSFVNLGEIFQEEKADISGRRDAELSIRRLLLMSYFPSGFWSRLMVRILADDAIVDVVKAFFIMPSEVNTDDTLRRILSGMKVEWWLWQTGMELKYANVVIFRLKEILYGVPNRRLDYSRIRFVAKQENIWTDVILEDGSMLELFLPLDTVVIKEAIMEKGEAVGYKAVVLEPSVQYATKLLALIVDHIDVLLEDWYPTLGTRFVHTSEGKFLVTRLIPCPRCVAREIMESEKEWNEENYAEQWKDDKIIAFEDKVYNKGRMSQESYASDGDSGVGESPSTSKKDTGNEKEVERNVVYSWIIEECILATHLKKYGVKCVACPIHGDMPLGQVAPDTIFLDLGEEYLIKPHNITHGKLLGRGAFGFVFRGTCKLKGKNELINVAMKMLQPIQPDSNASHSAAIAYKAAQGKWDQDPMQYASKAYCTARQELNILCNLQHAHIVPLVGICPVPLALVLDLAPLGDLSSILKKYRRSGARFEAITLQAIILQMAKALEYLHQKRVIYRDLKSENVLVWFMPAPFQSASKTNHPTHVKLADYGISRLTLPAGTKGFGGTEGFMAPEIMKYNGEEEYTEKVDCFSFGMFVYELLSLHQPFESHESVKECILEGGRPSLTQRETSYPTYMLDLMVLSWSQSPNNRLSASQLVSVASAPEFTHLYDVVALNHSAVVASAVAFTPSDCEGDEYEAEVWLACTNRRIDQVLCGSKSFSQYATMETTDCPTSLVIVNGNSIWMGDSKGSIHAYSLNEWDHVLFSYALATDCDASGVCGLVTLDECSRVVVALANGRIFLVRSDAKPSSGSMAEGSFVLTELGNSAALHAITLVYKDEGTCCCELWCGENDGNISIYTIRENSVVGHEMANHFEPRIPNMDVLQLASLSRLHRSVGKRRVTWSYIHPGCIVYEWDVDSRKISNKLDCSKLIPCSESIKSISIEEKLTPGKCQVTSICALNDQLYIGTAWGCLVVVDGLSFNPITVFRPYREEVFDILPLPPDKDGNHYLMTAGRGYRSLIRRYKDDFMRCNESTFHNDEDDNAYVMLWSTDSWITT